MTKLYLNVLFGLFLLFSGYSVLTLDGQSAGIQSATAMNFTQTEKTDAYDLTTDSISNHVDGLRDIASYKQSAQVEGTVIESFANTWGNNTIGLVFNSVSDQVRFVHENSPNLCIFDVSLTPPHSLVRDVDLQSQNSGWEIGKNKTGVGFDSSTNTYFITDFQGDVLSGGNVDDYIIEVDVNGIILNAWEMDDQLGSNDSHDGSSINNILDIAVVPGSPTRYFVAAANDGGKVYEITLIKKGWWVENSWATINTYEGAVAKNLGDNYGIDYDEKNQRLYHSDRNSNIILVTDLNMEPLPGVSKFTCAGSSGFNSGVTFIEGSSPAEVWVTDFESNETTRCQSPIPGKPQSLSFLLLLLLDD